MIYLFVLLVISIQVLYAQANSANPLKRDTSAIRLKYPATEQMEEFRNDRDYRYDNDPVPSENFFLRLLNWLQQKIRDFLKGPSYTGFWQYIIMAAMACLVMFLLYKAGIMRYLFPRSSESETIAYHIEEENIHEINFDTAIHDALSSGDHRLAIRLLYLKTLKLLTDRRLIQWKPNRTNRSYVLELANTDLATDFEKMTHYFESVWYGAFPVREPEFLYMKDYATSFHTKLTQS